MKKTNVLILIIVLFSAFYQIKAQETKEKKERNYENSALFESDDVIHIQMFADSKEMLRDVGDDRKYHKAFVRYTFENENQNGLTVKVKTRGNFRRNPANCNMPPLRIKISKKDRANDKIFKGQYMLKLVVPCRKKQEKFQEYVILEYLIYKTYELFEDVAYRTRLVELELIDSINPDKSLKMKGFFIEETKQLTDRCGGKVVNFKRFHQENVNREQMTKLAVFQYMIANTDWSVDVGHNIKLFFRENDNVPIAVPYDFDWSGIINAVYAKPAKNLDITSVRQRTFRGYERSMEEYDPIIKLFNEKKEEVYKLYKNCQWLSDKTKEATIKYLDEFYEIINDQKKVDKEFIKNCRKT
jgi:hypothetical protein